VPRSVPVDWDASDQRELAGTHQDHELAAGAL
jgi:hypothetical protein